MHNKQIVLLTVQDLSKLLGLTEAWIRRMVFQKKIPFYKIQGLIRFKLDEVLIWIDEQKNGGQNE
jgi:excisionase family DNA binding protein